VSSTATVRTLDWLVPLAFVACASWVIWNAPAYILVFGGQNDALLLRHAPAGALDWAALIGLPVLGALGIATVRPAEMEDDDIRGLDRLSLFLGRVTMLLIALLVSVMFYEVIVRYIFEKPTLWANELSLWIAGFIFLFAGLYAMQQRSHIRIFLLYDILPRPLQKLCDIISTGLIVLFAFALSYGAYGEAAAKFLRWETFGTAFDPPIPATMKPLILVAITLVAIQAVSNLIMDWNKAPEHHSPADEIDQQEIAAIKRTLGSDD
jgi:TRAP-type mannitol/chloroaromatic compound transport system permease small subunit